MPRHDAPRWNGVQYGDFPDERKLDPPWDFGPEGTDLPAVLAELEARMIERAMELGGTRKAAAKLLNIKRTTLQEKLKRARQRGHRLGRFREPR